MKNNKLNPLFDKNLELVGWVDSGTYIFDTAMNWVAFVANEHAWSAHNVHWLGPVKGMLCMDALGKPVAWNPQEGVSSILPPLRPPRASLIVAPQLPEQPAAPEAPAKPAPPRRGWSTLSFEQWLSQ